MKKLFLFLFVLMSVSVAFAQTLAYEKGYYYLVSPNSSYYVGSQEGTTAYRYNIETKEVNFIDADGDFGFKTNAVSNEGVVAGSYGFKAALWGAGNDYDLLPMPEGLTELEEATNDAVAISADGKQVVVAFNADGPKTYFVYTKKEDGSYDMVRLPMPEKDPLYSMYPQWIGVRDISKDGNTLIGFFITDDGYRQLPLIWHKKDGVWSYEFWGLDVCLKEGKTIPPYPYEYLSEDPETGDLELPSTIWEEWYTAQYEAETGYYYQLKGITLSGNARYVSFNMAIQLDGEAYGTIYAAAYDLEKDTLVVFEDMQNTTALSVNDNGDVIVGTPSTEEFRWSYIVPMHKSAEKQTLTEYVKTRSNGTIDLAKYMTYELDEGSTVAEGTAYWAKEGEGLVTFQLDLFGDGVYKSFFIRFDVKLDEPVIFDNQSLVVYPNPTMGILNLSKSMTNVVIYDVIGRKVYTQSNVEKSIDLSEFNEGQYFLVGEVDGKRYSTKLMIKK